VPITPAQSRLIEFLVAALASEVSEPERRWQGASDIARQYASDRRQLLLTRDWTADVVLDSAGDTWVIDTETGQAPRTATAAERREALFRALYHYPELLSLLPSRPATAGTCSVCEGTGVPEIRFVKPSFRSLVCQCAGAGWIVQDK